MRGKKLAFCVTDLHVCVKTFGLMDESCSHRAWRFICGFTDELLRMDSSSHWRLEHYISFEACLHSSTDTTGQMFENDLTCSANYYFEPNGAGCACLHVHVCVCACIPVTQREVLTPALCSEGGGAGPTAAVVMTASVTAVLSPGLHIAVPAVSIPRALSPSNNHRTVCHSGVCVVACGTNGAQSHALKWPDLKRGIKTFYEGNVNKVEFNNQLD